MTTQMHMQTNRCWWNPDEARWVCRSDEPRRADGPLIDVRDMIVVHTALLREFRLVPSAVARVDIGAVNRASVVDRHLAFLCDLLQHHHEGEDALLWPLLRARLPVSALGQVLEIEAQHTEITAALRIVGDARARWVETAGEKQRDRLVTGLEHLYVLLKDHVELEESAVLPLAASVLTAAEWGAIGEAAAGTLAKPALVLAIGMFAYEGEPAVLHTMLASAPAVPRLLVPLLGPRVYARRARTIYGTTRP